MKKHHGGSERAGKSDSVVHFSAGRGAAASEGRGPSECSIDGFSMDEFVVFAGQTP